MNRSLTMVKITLLLAGLTVVALSASAKASDPYCEGSGHTCHAMVDGQLRHLELK